MDNLQAGVPPPPSTARGMIRSDQIDGVSSVLVTTLPDVFLWSFGVGVFLYYFVFIEPVALFFFPLAFSKNCITLF